MSDDYAASFRKQAEECREQAAKAVNPIATGARTTRFCRTRIASFVLRAGLRSRIQKDPPCDHLRADAAASTASPPAFVTMDNAPLAGKGRGELVALAKSAFCWTVRVR